MKTAALFFPFDLFGSSGTRAGVELLADAFQEMLEDNRRERKPTRARAYSGKIQFREFAFETLERYQSWREDARQAVRQVLDRGDFLLWVTGNHLGALPVYEELGPDTLVLQLDAHLDIYNLSDCTTELSHGNFLLHAETPLPAIVNVGHRELLLPPKHVRAYFRAAHDAVLTATQIEQVLADVRERAASAKRVIIDLDCDVFDAAHFPGAATSLPFGLDPATVLRLIDAVWSDRVAGFVISEFDPAKDDRDRSLSTLMWLIEWMLLKLYES